MTSGILNSSVEAEVRPETPLPELRHSFLLERALMEKLYRQIGSPAVQLVLWDGTVIGPREDFIGRIQIRSPRVLRQVLINPLVCFGEAFAAGDLSVDGELIQVLVELNLGLARAHPHQAGSRLGRWTRSRNTLAKSKSSVYHHYDIGNDFYQLWLDPQMVYTCAYYPHPQATLAEAQTAKLDYVCRKLRLKKGETVAEAGCGWGALALHMAREYGVKVHAFNLSREQLAYARGIAREQGLADRVEFIEDDYRNITGSYDAFVSVGMLEHVGPENYKTLGSVIGHILKPQGRGLIHSIGRNYGRPLDPWTVKYIFPGAYAPSLREMMDILEEPGFSVHDVENLRLHYARTCADWLANFDGNADKVARLFDERFVRMWRLYLASASASFVSGDLQLFQVVFARGHNNELPWTRADWYADRPSPTTSG